jgi:XapX domain-containing protein
MKMYIISLSAGILVGVIYGLMGVRSPAPPLVALAGLLGILIGEQVVPFGKHLIQGSALSAAWAKTDIKSHIFGVLPGQNADITKSS